MAGLVKQSTQNLTPPPQIKIKQKKAHIAQNAAGKCNIYLSTSTRGGHSLRSFRQGII
jgi:hypothetical protein